MLPVVRRRPPVLLSVVIALAAAPRALGAAPAVTVTAAPVTGQAPLTVTLTAAGDAATYHWDLGDGATAAGAGVQHTYAAGLWTATVTATAPDGETGQAHIVVHSETVTLAAVSPATYGRVTLFTGSLRPAVTGARVFLDSGGHTFAHGTTGADGGFRIRARAGAPGAVVAHADQAASPPFMLAVRPAVTIGFAGRETLDGKLSVVARIRPASAGTLALTVRRAGGIVKTLSGDDLVVPLDTRLPGNVVVTAAARAAPGWTPARTTASTTVAYPQLAEGANGSSVGALRARLAALGYEVPPASTSFDSSLLDAVYAFQKVQGLPRTGIVSAAVWARLDHPFEPRPRYPGPAAHIEVDKTRQVLYIVRGGRIRTIVPVSTAGVPGDYTPTGRFAIYRKVVGFDPSPLGTLYDPMYFTGGYAIHGNPSVPPYPASHGCIRVPMWIAPLLYTTNDYGETVYVY
ncbi:MAG TPA: L,D-transpeptidase family protein [Gaiellaceae bacterium]|nr:L,D-transpeptidase family protein [Gaiellaceae bacterium]